MLLSKLIQLLLKTLIEKIDDGSILNKILDEEIYSYSRQVK